MKAQFAPHWDQVINLKIPGQEMKTEGSTPQIQSNASCDVLDATSENFKSQICDKNSFFYLKENEKNEIGVTSKVHFGVLQDRCPPEGNCWNRVQTKKRIFIF